MKKIIGNGAGTTILTGAINPGSNNLDIDSASIGDVNVYGGRLYIKGGVALEGKAATSGYATVEFNGGTFGNGGYVAGSAIINSAILGENLVISSGASADFVGSGGSMVNLNQHGVSTGLNCHVTVNDLIFSGGSVLNTAVLRISSGTTAQFSNCIFTGNVTSTNGIFYQNGNTTSTYWDNCIFSNNRALNLYAGFYKANNGIMKITSCTITGCTARSTPVLVNANGGQFIMSDCIVSDNVVQTNATHCTTTGTSAYFESCTFVNNSSTEKNHNGRVFVLGNTVTMVDCYIEPIISSPQTAIYTSATCKYTISGGVYPTIQNLGITTLNGNVSLNFISSGTVNINSGCSIALEKDITATAINVEEGGCVVNGSSIAEGTYTSIDSNGNAT